MYCCGGALPRCVESEYAFSNEWQVYDSYLNTVADESIRYSDNLYAPHFIGYMSLMAYTCITRVTSLIHATSYLLHASCRYAFVDHVKCWDQHLEYGDLTKKYKFYLHCNIPLSFLFLCCLFFIPSLSVLLLIHLRFKKKICISDDTCSPKPSFGFCCALLSRVPQGIFCF